MISRVIERCGWPFPGEAPGKEELGSRINHPAYPQALSFPREAPGKEPSSTNYHL